MAKLAGVPDLEWVIVYLSKRLDASEARAVADRDRFEQLEDEVSRLTWDRSDVVSTDTEVGVPS